MDNSKQYFLLIEDKEQGPFTLSQVRDLLNDGTVNSSTFFCQPGWSEWRVLSEILKQLRPTIAEPVAAISIGSRQAQNFCSNTGGEQFSLIRDSVNENIYQYSVFQNGGANKAGSVLVKTNLGSAAWLFTRDSIKGNSPCSDYAKHLLDVWDQVSKLVEGKINTATVRQNLQDSLDGLGYRSPADEVGELTDLRSDQRLDMMICTNTEMAQGYGDWQQSQDSLDAYPAQELIRAESREKQREWYDRWTAAGGQVFDGQPVGQAIEDGVSGRMIALINDPIWEAISAFGLPYPPFDFNSGLDVRPVDRQEAQDFGLIQQDETPEQADLGLNSGRIGVVPVAEGPLRDALLADLGNYEFTDDGILRIKE